MFSPASTYRIQFHKGFTFSDFENTIPYLQQLGVQTVYASPIFKAVPGSIHGYDVTDPNQINPEIGTIEQLRQISARLKNAGMSWLQDIVPNHMAVHPDNTWLMDVLEHGEASAYSAHFDIDWQHPGFKGKVMMPVLAGTLEEAISAKDIAMVNDNGELSIRCNDAVYPLNNASLSESDKADGQGITDNINNDPSKLQALLDKQYYTLTNWRDTEKEINYRRFFLINGLICLNIQHEHVFSEYHGLIRQLCNEGVFQGLRVDHIDGLYDPLGYLERLRALAGDDKYIAVEKILEQGEELPEVWPIQGTTGYDFLGKVNNLFTDHRSRKVFTKLYSRQATEQQPFADMLRERKALILYNHMQGELDNLYRQLQLLDVTGLTETEPDDMKKVIGEFLIQCPVYKLYGRSLPLSGGEADTVREILLEVKKQNKQYIKGADLLEALFLDSGNKADKNKNIQFYKRCMQFTGPLMAKGMEDTLMYNYNRFIGHSEVGDTPHAFGYSIASFHKYMQERQANWPAAMNATATHDTKRGEDARARLNVLSDLPEEWAAAVKELKKAGLDGSKEGIDSNDVYFIYQSILACHPMPGAEDDFQARFRAYMEKALRESKAHTQWAEPNAEYEQKIATFISKLLDYKGGFLSVAGSLFTDVADAGIVNSLAQTLLRFTCPGVPDTYQGTELWDMSMVDPDNRRPVDYIQRETWLKESDTSKGSLPENWWDDRYSGKVKLWLTYMLLHERTSAPDVFNRGVYTKLPVKGKYKDNVIAFARTYRNTSYVIVAPLHTASIAKKQGRSVRDIDWKDTSIDLPNDKGQTWTNAFSGKKTVEQKMALKELLGALPVAMLQYKEKESNRSAGVLMPVFSLPSAFGIGDFGPEAYKFVDFLSRGGQRYWQILPLSPILAAIDNSPYSSISGMAGNTLYISPEILVKDGLLTDEDITDDDKIAHEGDVDYTECDKIKDRLCEKAYRKYLAGDFSGLKARFSLFCDEQRYWLDDFALFVVIKRHQSGLAWYEWPLELRKRDKDTLKEFSNKNKDEIHRIKWQQFIADDQWQRIRVYCKRKDVQLFGDMPFYVSYDSADVWADPHLFSLDKDGNITGISGVPPDYFSATGQLWNMPTYAWDAVKADGYQWWMRRLKRNLELFDVIRLDHFRAFEAYWEVPAGEETAVNGKWLKGPGMDFFDAVNAQLGALPFVAEDLGYEMEDVYALREKTGLPGMKVLQFAWGANMPVAPDAPHNYISNCFVYTGTHDNNTTKGWYRQETGKDERERLERYAGGKVKEKDVADTLIQLAYGSVAKTVILPLQDVLGYGPEARINLPGSSTGNWLWRLPPDALTKDVEDKLHKLVTRYNR